MSNHSEIISQALGTIRSVAGVSATITRGGTSVTFTGVQGSTRFQEQDDNGFTVETISRDWIVKVDAFGELGMPRAGDKITNDIATYQVMHPEYRWHDFSKTHIRVFTKVIN